MRTSKKAQRRAADVRNLADYELLELLLGARVAGKLYTGSLTPIFEHPVGSTLPPLRCLVARELVQRLLLEQLKEKRSLNKPADVGSFLRAQFCLQQYESFLALHLDSQHRLIAAEELFRGTLNQTSVYPREVVKSALQNNAAAIIFAHNHPSGIAEPSHADELLTRSLRSALALVEVQVLDHFIVAGNAVLSFAERGLL